jgi:hypothetical protein
LASVTLVHSNPIDFYAIEFSEDLIPTCFGDCGSAGASSADSTQ